MCIIDKVLRIFKKVQGLDSKYGVFGVNGFGALLTESFPHKIMFLADEDKEKWNLKFLDKRIINPKNAELPILVAFRNEAATKEILKNLELRYPHVGFVNLFRIGEN